MVIAFFLLLRIGIDCLKFFNLIILLLVVLVSNFVLVTYIILIDSSSELTLQLYLRLSQLSLTVGQCST